MARGTRRVGVERRVENGLRVARLEPDGQARDRGNRCDAARPQTSAAGTHAELPPVGEGEIRMVARGARHVLLATQDRVEEQEPAEVDAGGGWAIAGRMRDLAQRPQVEARPQVVVGTGAGRRRRSLAAAHDEERHQTGHRTRAAVGEGRHTPGYRTSIVPIIPAWIVHWYR